MASSSRGALTAGLIFCAIGLIFTVWFARVGLTAPAGEAREELFRRSYLALVALAGWISGLPVVFDRMLHRAR